MSGRRLFLALAGIGVVVSGWFVSRSLNDNLVYYLFPNEAIAQRDAFPDGAPFRLAGTVVTGTLVEDGPGFRFEVTDGSATIPVWLKASPPPLFGEDVRVLLPGAWQGEVFVATEVVVQHDENYQTPTEGNFEEG